MISDVSERDPVEVLAEEFMDRQRRNERVSVEEYAKRFPNLADRIRTVFPALQLLEEFKPEVTAERDPPAMLKQLGEFRIVRFLGRGGMGVVYEAVQETLDRRVALKVLPADLARDPDFRTRFHREARMAAQLHHPNIVAVHGAGQTEGMQFLVMELIDGASLDGVLTALMLQPMANISRSKATPRVVDLGRVDTPPSVPMELAQMHHDQRVEYYRTVADVISQCADALAYAHGHGVIHRDIKPGNILLARSEQNGGRIEPKITDFGLAKAEGAGDLTRSGFVVGTPRYVAPERFNGADTPAGDVFALGATMFELLTLQHAFDAPTRERLIDVIHRNEPTRPRELVADVPNDLEIITQKALAKNPQQRYTAAAFAEDLRRWLDGRPILARRVGPIEKLVAWSRRNPLIAGLTAGLFLTLTIGLIASLLLWRTAESNRIAAEDNFKTADAEFRRAEDNAKEARRQQVEAEKALAQALAALDEFFQKVSQEKLLNVPGLQPLRRDLLLAALKYYQDFSAQHHNDPSLRRETAKALMNAGRIQGIVGTRDESRPLLEKSYQAYAALVQEFPNDVEVRGGMARAAEHLAVIRYTTHQLPAARALFLESAQHSERLGDVSGRYWMAWGLIRAAEVSKDLGRFAEALADLPKARATLQELIKENQAVRSCTFALARADMVATNIYRRQRAGEAMAAARSALERMEQLCKDDANDHEYGRALARAHVQLGLCEADRGQHDEARRQFDRGRDILVKLLAENPTVHDYQIAIASNLRYAGEMERVLKNYERAEDQLRESARIYQDHHTKDPEDGAVARSLAEVLSELGLTLQALRRPDDAIDVTTQAANAYEFLLQKAPDNRTYRSNLAASLSNKANMLNLRGDYEPAVDIAKSAIEHQSQAIAPGGRAPTSAPRFLMQHYSVLWTALRNLDRWPEHDASMQEYVKRHATKGGALIRAAREHCECIQSMTAPVGPPSIDQIERAEKSIQAALTLLRQALEVDAAGAKKEFSAPQFRILNRRPEYRKLAEKFKTDL